MKYAASALITAFLSTLGSLATIHAETPRLGPAPTAQLGEAGIRTASAATRDTMRPTSALSAMAEETIVLEDKLFLNRGAIIEVPSVGPPLTIICRRVSTVNCGPLVVSHGPATDEMRDVTLLMEDCRIDGGWRAKGVHLDSVGIKRATITRCSFTRCLKAAIQFGTADLFQSRRENIVIKDCTINGVIDREGDDEESHGIFLLAVQNAHIEDVSICNVTGRDGLTMDCEGIYTKARDVFIFRCSLHNAGFSAISIKGIGETADTDPLHFRVGDRVTVRGCRITTSPEFRGPELRGVLVNCGGSVTVKNCGINDVRMGVTIEQPRGATGNVEVVGNTFRRMRYGVFVRAASQPLKVVANEAIGCFRLLAPRVWPIGSIADLNLE